MNVQSGKHFNEAAFSANGLDKRFIVTFYGKEMGVIDIAENANPEWTPLDQDLCGILSKSRYADMPALVHNLHPNQSIMGFLLNAKTKEDYYKTHFKTLSNIRFFQIDGYYSKYAHSDIGEDIDRLDGKIDDFTNGDGVLHCRYDGPVGTVGLERLPYSKLKKMTSVLEHRVSGNESKAFAHLSKKGRLQLASEGRSFTHFIKFGEAGGRESHPLMEWMGLELMKEVGLTTTQAALVKVDDQCSPALAVERFDIPDRKELPNRKKMIQDFFTIFGRDPADENSNRNLSYQQLMKDFVSFSKKLPAEKQQEVVKSMFTRIVAAWAMSDEDLHSKNLSILMDIDIDNPENSTFDMSPAYDGHINIACGSHGASMFYKMHDKVNGGATAKINMNDFVMMLRDPALSVNGKKFCVFDSEDEIKEFVQNISSKCAYKAAEMASNPPSFISELRYGPMYLQDMKLAAAIVIERAKLVKADYPKDFEYSGIFKWGKKYGPKARASALKSGRDLNPNDVNDQANISRYRSLLFRYENKDIKFSCNREVDKTRKPVLQPA